MEEGEREEEQVGCGVQVCVCAYIITSYTVVSREVWQYHNCQQTTIPVLLLAFLSVLHTASRRCPLLPPGSHQNRESILTLRPPVVGLFVFQGIKIHHSKLQIPHQMHQIPFLKVLASYSTIGKKKKIDHLDRVTRAREGYK